MGNLVERTRRRTVERTFATDTEAAARWLLSDYLGNGYPARRVGRVVFVTQYV